MEWPSQDGAAPRRYPNPGAAGPDVASVRIGEEEFTASADRPFVFGRNDADGIVGLDRHDMGISGVAGSIETMWGVWWVVNQSTKRTLVLEHPDRAGRLQLAPGHRHALTTERVDVLVPGALYTHVLKIVLPGTYVAQLRGGNGRFTTGTLTGAPVNLTPREHDALTALFAGYLESFPRRREHPNTYEEAAALLPGDGWTGDKVRKAVERVKQRFADKQDVYFDGPQANYDLAACLISAGVLSGKDLARLRAR